MEGKDRKPVWQHINTVFLIAVFLTILVGTAVLSAVTPRQDISQLEKRRLADPPELTWHSLASGSFASGLQDYAQDHIVWRDQWIDLFSFIETSLFRKREINGIVLGKDGWMFAENFELSDKDRNQFERNLADAERFAERYGDRVTLLLVPPAEMIYPDKLPADAPQRDLNSLYDEVCQRLSGRCQVEDVREAFRLARENVPLYYKTDHHWTADGAYLAYSLFCDQKGYQPFSLQDHTRVDIPDFLGSHYSLSRWARAEGETLSYYETDSIMTVMKVLNENDYAPESEQPLVNEETLGTWDKYGAFLDGNHGYVEITGKGTGSILLVKDSYANCFVPYLTDNYARIGCVDFRTFSYGLDTTIASREYEDILLLYGLNSFIEDTGLARLNRPSISGLHSII